MNEYYTNVELLLPLIRRIHADIRAAVVKATEGADAERLSTIATDDAGDTIYAIDKVSEDVLIDLFEREVAPLVPVVVIAEGLPGGKVVLPHGTAEEGAVWRVIIDPIDGTRGIMYQKRSAWILTGIAPNKGPKTQLRDIVLAVQTEIPTNKQHLSDSAWAIRGRGAQAERYNRLTGESRTLVLHPSKAASIAHGYTTVARFFPGARETLAAIDDEVVMAALGPVQPGKAHCFEDQYACSGGQLYELMCGHDRFIADLRPLMEPLLRKQGRQLGLCCHPYDVCTELIARELGVIVTDAFGDALDADLAVEPDIAWVGYANAAIQEEIEPRLQDALKSRDLFNHD
jgi:fructose-1,6-bisphosphatase/inositol monophosphatase family enzyme